MVLVKFWWRPASVNQPHDLSVVLVNMATECFSCPEHVLSGDKWKLLFRICLNLPRTLKPALSIMLLLEVNLIFHLSNAVFHHFYSIITTWQHCWLSLMRLTVKTMKGRLVDHHVFSLHFTNRLHRLTRQNYTSVFLYSSSSGCW